MIIYKSTNLITGKCYIGQTIKSLNKRINEHINDIKRDNSYLHRAIRKYGIENFKWEIICECSSREELNEKEQYYIKELNTKTPYGYNLTDGGGGISGWHHTDEAKKKMSKAKEGMYIGVNNINYGKEFSKETRQKMSNAKIGKKLSDEHRKNISKATSGKNNPMYGTISPNKGKFGENSSYYKTYEITYPNGEIKIIKCLKTFCMENNFNYGSVAKARYIKENKPYKGYIIRELLINE